MEPAVAAGRRAGAHRHRVHQWHPDGVERSGIDPGVGGPPLGNELRPLRRPGPRVGNHGGAPVGASVDHFELVGRTIKLAGGRLTTEEGTLAGAHLDMASAVRNAVRLAKVSLEDALRAASLTPARFLGLDKERGALVAGVRADLVALTEDLRVVATWLDGESDDVKSN